MKKLKIFLLFIIFIYILFGQQAMALEVYTITYPAVFSDTSPMNFRNEPSTGAEIIGRVNMYTPVTILEDSGNFYKASAKCTDNSTKTGYLSKQYIKEISPKYTVTAKNDTNNYSAPLTSSQKGILKEGLVVNTFFEVNGYSFYINDENSYGFINSDMPAVKNNPENILKASVVFAVDSPIALNKGSRTKIDVPAFIHENRSMIPVRYTTEWFGGYTMWNDSDKCVDVNIDGKTIKFFTGRNEILVNDVAVPIDIAPVIVEDRSYVPIRALADAIGKYTYFNADNKQLVISEIKIDNEINEFYNYVNKNFNLYSDLRGEGIKIPSVLPVGREYSLGGNILSDKIINRIALFIFDENNGQEFKLFIDNNSKSFSVKELSISFEELPAGKKRIEIWAADEIHSRLVMDEKFGIVDIKDKFLWPVPFSTGLSSCYGYDGNRWHPAIDITGDNGSEVIAGASGKILDIYNEAADNFPKGESGGSGYGNYVKIEHFDKINGETVVTKYNHLSKVTVSAGDIVAAGEKIGEIGSTGSSYGFHLDYQVFLNGTVTDPAPFILPPENLKFTGTTVDCCIPYINNLKEMNNMN